MRKITIYNPVAGNGDAGQALEYAEAYCTKAPGDCRRYVRGQCEVDPNTHFVVCGGDGTLSEAVCGIMDAGAGQTAALTVIPCGSGNDTVKSIPSLAEGVILPLDLIAYEDRFGINMINIGFDCNVVATAGRLKKKWKIAGNLSYILGVAAEFFKPFGEYFKISALCEDGSRFEYEGPTLLCAVCNGQWCGGSFHNSPYSDMSDGLLEMILVKKTSRLNFVKLIGKYKNGSLLDRDTGLPPKGYEHLIVFRRIKELRISGTARICIDGEIIDTKSACFSVLPSAIRYKL